MYLLVEGAFPAEVQELTKCVKNHLELVKPIANCLCSVADRITPDYSHSTEIKLSQRCQIQDSCLVLCQAEGNFEYMVRKGKDYFIDHSVHWAGIFPTLPLGQAMHFLVFRSKPVFTCICSGITLFFSTMTIYPLPTSKNANMEKIPLHQGIFNCLQQNLVGIWKEERTASIK